MQGPMATNCAFHVQAVNCPALCHAQAFSLGIAPRASPRHADPCSIHVHSSECVFVTPGWLIVYMMHDKELR